MEVWLERLFWFSAIMVALVTVGYPIFLALSGPLVRRRRRLDDAEPTVSLIVSAYNEEAVIARRLGNALELDYPRERLEIIVASDGSTDRTDDIVRSFADRGVLLRSYPRTGKTGVQNLTARTATGEILVFSDANASYRPDAIRKLVRNFAEPDVACVCGQLVYRVAGDAAGDCERSYWDYEKFMKRRESDLSSLIGANGSIYAVRRADYVEIDNDLISDLVEPLALVATASAWCTSRRPSPSRRRPPPTRSSSAARSASSPAAFGDYCTCGALQSLPLRNLLVPAPHAQTDAIHCAAFSPGRRHFLDRIGSLRQLPPGASANDGYSRGYDIPRSQIAAPAAKPNNPGVPPALLLFDG